MGITGIRPFTEQGKLWTNKHKQKLDEVLEEGQKLVGKIAEGQGTQLGGPEIGKAFKAISDTIFSGARYFTDTSPWKWKAKTRILTDLKKFEDVPQPFRMPFQDKVDKDAKKLKIKVKGIFPFW